MKLLHSAPSPNTGASEAIRAGWPNDLICEIQQPAVMDKTGFTCFGVMPGQAFFKTRELERSRGIGHFKNPRQRWMHVSTEAEIASLSNPLGPYRSLDDKGVTPCFDRNRQIATTREFMALDKGAVLPFLLSLKNRGGL